MTPDGQNDLLQMPHGIANSGGIFIRGLKNVWEGFSAAISMIIIVIYNDSCDEHLRTLKELFGRLRRITA